MATFFNKTQFLFKRIKINEIWKQQAFHKNSCLFDQSIIAEKPSWLKKFKLKQAALQKNDELPTFLKKGLPDKILYNATLFGVIAGLIWGAKVICDEDIPYRKKS